MVARYASSSEAGSNRNSQVEILLRKASESVITVIVLFAAVVSLASGCAHDSDVQTELDNYMKHAVSTWKFSGAVLVAKGDSVLLRSAYGVADEQTGRLLNPETKFLIGSMTKPITAIAIHQLLNRSKLSLEDHISAYLPGYRKDVADSVTIYHLISQQSGIPDLVNLPGFQERAADPITVDEMIGYFEDLPLQFPPGDRYTYSSSNYVLLGAIIEEITGQSWEEYIKGNILDPVGMTNTGVFVDYGTREDFARGYQVTPNGAREEARVIHPSCGYAAGGLASTVDDLYALNLALFGDSLLPQSLVDQMLTPQTPFYAYGWLVDELGGHGLTAHGGATPGFVSMLQRWVDDSVCIIVISNNVLIPAHTVANGLAAITFGDEYELPKVKKPKEVNVEELKQYVGLYRIDSSDYRQIELESGQLVAKRLNGFPAPIHLESPDHFYFDRDHMSTLEFVRDEKGAVSGHVLRQAFVSDTAWLVTGEEADRLLYGGTLVTPDPAILEKYTGKFKINPAGFVLTITLDGGDLYGQAFSSAPIKLKAVSDSSFAFEGLSARVLFFRDVSGAADSLRFSQDGQKMFGRRVE
jgi:CubicO group peptidase (beta-lactamase class C family)